MKGSRRDELRRLLVAIGDLVHVECEGKTFTPSGYRDFSFQKIFSRSVLSHRSMAPKIVAMDSYAKAKLLEFIRSELSEYILNGEVCCSMIRISGGRGTYTLEDLLQTLLRISVIWGVDNAIQSLERAIEEDSFAFQSMTLITGVKVDDKLKIDDGVHLVPLSNSPAHLPSHLPINYPMCVETRFLGRAFISQDRFVSPALAKSESPGKEFRFSTVLEKNKKKPFNIEDFCFAISLACNEFIQPSISWKSWREDDLFSEFGGPGRSYVHYITADGHEHRTQVTEHRINEANLICRQLYNLEDEVRGVLDIAISRWTGSRKAKGFIDRMIDLGIAFESIYLGGGNRSQLDFTFRVRAAWYLGENVEERKRLMKTFKAIYKCRSDAVHNGKIPSCVQEIPLYEFIIIAENLCRRSIMKVLQEGALPDWDSLIVGGNAT